LASASRGCHELSKWHFKNVGVAAHSSAVKGSPIFEPYGGHGRELYAPFLHLPSARLCMLEPTRRHRREPIPACSLDMERSACRMRGAPAVPPPPPPHLPRPRCRRGG
jgi:hypothetical protein